jgi:hypothetical protein
MNRKTKTLFPWYLCTFFIFFILTKTQGKETKILTAQPYKLNYFMYQLKGNIDTDDITIVDITTEVGFCISDHPIPTVNDTKIICKTNFKKSFNTIAGTNYLKKGKKYYVRSYSIIANDLIYGNEQEISTLDQHFNIGEEYQGGIIVYIFEPSDQLYIKGEVHGIIAAPADLKETYSWDCIIDSKLGKQRIITSKTTKDEVGTGKFNTKILLEEFQQRLQLLNTVNQVTYSDAPAAKICGELTLNGYKDWFLPSLSEMMLMWFHQNEKMKLKSKMLYWTSTTYNTNKAVSIGFASPPMINEKSQQMKLAIRPMRYF